jgi:CRISPR-associated protein Cmr6
MSAPFYTPAGQKHPDNLPVAGNTGLWFTRFYNRFADDWSVGDDGKTGWIKTVSGERGDRAVLEAAASRIERLGQALGAEVADFKTEANFATGLGLSHPVENGFTWHHTLGVPYLPASGVKGLLRGWVEAWMEPADEGEHTRLIQRWFGAAKENDGAEDRVGGLIFFDALPIAPPKLIADVMTPHLGKWYEQGGEIKSAADYADKAPADWHSPVPVPFLAVSRGIRFRFMIAPRLSGDASADQHARQDAKEAMTQLALALEWMGAGAKTATGYGRMQRDGARSAAALAEAGIQTGTAQWIGAKVTRNKSTGELTVMSAEGEQAAPMKSPQAQTTFNGLGEAAQKKLKDGKKPLLMTATVETTGNLKRVTLLVPEGEA